jgi:hypothetical protein
LIEFISAISEEELDDINIIILCLFALDKIEKAEKIFWRAKSIKDPKP